MLKGLDPEFRLATNRRTWPFDPSYLKLRNPAARIVLDELASSMTKEKSRLMGLKDENFQS
jgi:hypothetical protein